MKALFIFMFTIIFFGFTSNENDVIIKSPNHSNWNILLKKYIDNEGNVNYNDFKKDSVLLYDYLNELAENAPSNNWSKKDKLAYYINIYNAATVQLILDNYPIKSIKDIKNPWDKEWIKIGVETFSLNQIEHKILRKMNEPRIHFAINCASYSCPKLSNEAYISENIEKQLQKATFDFINDSKKNKLSENSLQLSAIFKWYKGDFTKNKSLIDYIKPFTKVNINSKAKINYLDYDWSLNEIK
mgnify:CR=1 FL=1|tara:strand:- start:127056 stop:127781 length:726 start_codon:yes stop_codon:yes gene_type:complete